MSRCPFVGLGRLPLQGNTLNGSCVPVHHAAARKLGGSAAILSRAGREKLIEKALGVDGSVPRETNRPDTGIRIGRQVGVVCEGCHPPPTTRQRD